LVNNLSGCVARRLPVVVLSQEQKMKKKLFLLAIILIAAAKADAASITAMPRANNDKIVDVSITGRIEGGDDDQFYTAIRHIETGKIAL
jgi:hypothetical protein